MAVKRGMFFTLDGLLALSIVIVGIILVSQFYTHKPVNIGVNFASNDITRIFSSITVGELDNEYVKSLIQSGKITDMNNTIFDQLGLFWAVGDMELAENFTRNITESIFSESLGISVLVDGEEIYSRSTPAGKTLVSSRSMVSGITKFKPIEGFSSKVVLTSISTKKILSYAYFGGFIGDGTVSQYIMLPSNYSGINQAYMEFALESDFDLQVNGVDSGSYFKIQNNTLKSNKYNISSTYYSNFHSGLNMIKIIFRNQSKYIGGGFFKVDVNSTNADYLPFTYDQSNNNVSRATYLSGVEGVINIYSSFYVPGQLRSARLFLNYTTDYPVYVNFGNKTIYSSNQTGNISLTLENNSIYPNFNDDYASLSGKTVPLRIGHYTTSKINVNGSNVDLFIDTPLDISMDTEDVEDSPGLSRLDVTKIVEKIFVDLILNKSLTNRIGLVSYHSSVEPGQTVDLTNNNVTLKNQIDGYSTKSVNTCFSCAIKASQDRLLDKGNTTRKWYIILIGDGVADKCDAIPQAKCTPAVAKNESIDYACNASKTYNITFFTIAIGAGADNTTLKNISEDCSDGRFFYGNNKSQLQQAFSDIGDSLISIDFILQKSFATGINSALHPNSYLEIQYTPEIPPFVFGNIPVTVETDAFGNNITTANVSILPNVNVTEMFVTSYSGDKWTDKAAIDGITVFNLSEYNVSYTELGDPFLVNIPATMVHSGNNTIDIRTSLGSSKNISGGSPDDKAIYTMLIKNSASSSSVASKAEGCIWTLEFSDGTSSVIKVPSSYSGTSTCNFASGEYNSNDSIDTAAYQLFSSLDFDKDGKLDVNIQSNDFDTTTLTISDVPSLWGPAIMEVRAWE